MSAPAARPAWYVESLRWFAAIFDDVARRMESEATDPRRSADALPYEEFISDVRSRIHNRYY